MMRAFMTRPCDKYFTLKRKAEKFLKMSLNVYNVPENEQNTVLEKINSMDMTQTAKSVLNKLFAALEMTFDFKFRINNHLED